MTRKDDSLINITGRGREIKCILELEKKTPILIY